MKTRVKSLVALGLSIAVFLSGPIRVFATDDFTVQESEVFLVSEQQSNAINMLNYLRSLAQEIRESSNSRMYLEEVYSSLFNNTNPNAIDSQTLDEVEYLVDTIEKYRMISVKRERLQYIYEQNQAQAIKSAVPNPVGLLSLTNAFSMPKLALSLAYMAVDSVTSYQSAAASNDLQYLQDGWQLDDEEAENLHNSRKGLYSYMVNMVNTYKLDGRLALNEDAVDDFVLWDKNENLQRKIQFFESKQKTYQAFGPYWLSLAKCYYENEEYQKCLDAIESYEKLNIDIFRKDYQYAEILPMAIEASYKVYEEKEFEGIAANYCDVILANCDDEQWELRYYAAGIFCQLFANSENAGYLEKAYDVLLNNVNYLVDEQKKLNKTYLADIEEQKTPKGATNQQKEDIKKYNSMLKSDRKKELAPIYEPLLVNCDLLLSVADKLQISDEEKERIHTILYGDGDPLVLIQPLDALYNNEGEIIPTEDIEAAYGGKTFTIPVKYVSSSATIQVEIEGVDEPIIDWTIDKVARKDKHDINTFYVTYKSAEAKKLKFEGDEKIKVTVLTDQEHDFTPMTFQFTATRNKAVGFLSTWDWLDDASSWSDSIKFERITE